MSLATMGYQDPYQEFIQGNSRVPTFTGKPGKMRVHLENLEKSWNFAKNNKNHGKITWNLEKYLGRL